MESYISRIEKGNSFIVVRRSRPVFKISPPDENADIWEPVIDFTKIKKGGIPIGELLSRLQLFIDKIAKALEKFTTKECAQVKELLEKILKGGTQHLSVKKLKGRNDIFRVRKGNIRIIYRNSDDGIHVLTIERRNDNTYKS